ncbi:MAG: hypothetical protein R3C27_16190 [Hyphomonadaceae bacterium]
MTDAKTHKREVRTVWNAVRRDRRERSRLTSAIDLSESAQRLETHAAALKALAQSAPSSEVPKSEDPKPARLAKTKNKPKSKRASVKKAKRAKKK